MKKVSKLVLIDSDNKYLLLRRNNHPIFGNDPDLPGGTMEEGESLLDTMVREVKEETGLDVNNRVIREVYSGTDYSNRGTFYSLFISMPMKRPSAIRISWEHISYEWLEQDIFLEYAKNANDTYMQMVYDVLNKLD